MTLTQYLLDAPFGHRLTKTPDDEFRTELYGDRGRVAIATAPTFDESVYKAFLQVYPQGHAERERLGKLYSHR